MPTLSLHVTLPWPLPGNERIAWYSPARKSWILGNHADKVLLSPEGKISSLVTRADPYAQKTTAYDNQLSPADDADLRAQRLHGFELLTRPEYDTAFAGKSFGSTCPVDQTLGLAGLTSGLPVRHPSTGAILSTTGKTLTLHALETSGLAPLAQAKLKASLTAILAEPNRILYGTNAGHLIALPLTAESFGKQKTLATFDRVLTSIAQTSTRLFLGGMGYVAELSPADTLTATHALPCRAIHALSDHWLLLNQGLHGLRLVDISDARFRPDASLAPPEPIDSIVPSSDRQTLLALTKPPAPICLCTIQLS